MFSYYKRDYTRYLSTDQSGYAHPPPPLPLQIQHVRGEEILSINQRKPPQLDRYLCFHKIYTKFGLCGNIKKKNKKNKQFNKYLFTIETFILILGTASGHLFIFSVVSGVQLPLPVSAIFIFLTIQDAQNFVGKKYFKNIFEEYQEGYTKFWLKSYKMCT